MNAVKVLGIVEWKFISTFNIQKSISSIEILKFLIQFPFLDNRSINRNITANFGNEKQMLELLEAIHSFLWPPALLSIKYSQYITICNWQEPLTSSFVNFSMLNHCTMYILIRKQTRRSISQPFRQSAWRSESERWQPKSPLQIVNPSASVGAKNHNASLKASLLLLLMLSSCKPESWIYSWTCNFLILNLYH